ncbi:sulfatase [Labilibaculum filiforme]|uniref:Sulfatase n=1 Tax=Labilibaculum filiforme TaxID=1940526 RepID=A0A2N3HUP0_9BACT|nr:sulfatase-like hydrolase/transferase [Labilibaculum filiforme]PKQ61758.1 sulfatase [Labilibaculum filiforme]
MKRFRCIVCLGLFVSLLFFSFLPTSAQKKTNIIMLLADDAGYHDFGFQGSKTFKTPNLDKLASEGMVFNQAYTTDAVCGPSRAALLTGIYPQRYGIEENNVPGYMSASSKLLGDEMGLPVDIKTVADYLHPLGYQSIILGKWHLGNADRYHPLGRGFDEFYGFRGGARSFFPLSQKEAFTKHDERMEKGFGNFQEPDKYLTDAIADEACDFIERNQKKPFFMYVSFNAVHSPLESKASDLDLFKDLTGERKQLAAMTYAMDRACGKIMDKLKELGLEENSLIVFANDNGGPDGTMTCNYPLSGCKSNYLEGGIRVPCIMKLPSVIKAGSEYTSAVSMLDMLPTFLNTAGGNANKIAGLDGVDLLPYITNKTKTEPHKLLFWKKENRGVVLKGDWKMLRFPDRPAELYNLEKDITESNNLAYKYPEKVREMFKLLWEWESDLERPLWQLKRVYEVNAMKRMDEKRTPVLDK